MIVGLYFIIYNKVKTKTSKIPKFQNPIENHRKSQPGYH